MIPQERIEQAAGAYYDELLKEKNRTTGQFVGVPLTHKEIGSQVTGYIEGMTAGVRFAESEAQTFEVDFAGHVKAKIEFKNGELIIISSMNGYGDAIDPDQIIINKIQPQ